MTSRQTQLYTSIFQSLPWPCVVVDASPGNHEIIAANQRLKDIEPMDTNGGGQQLAELLGWFVAEKGEALQEDIRQAIQEAGQNNDTARMACKVLKEDSDNICEDALRFIPLTDDDGKCSAFLVIFPDCIVALPDNADQRAQLSVFNEKAQHDSDNFKLAVEAAQAGTFSIDVAQFSLEASAHLKRIFGVAEQEPLDYPTAIHMVREDYRQQVEAGIQHTIKNAGKFDMELPILPRKATAELWIRAMGTVQADKLSDKTYFSGLVVTLVPQGPNSSPAGDRQDLFKIMAERSDVLIAMSDESSNAVYFNKAWSALTGRSMQDLLDYGWLDLIHVDDSKQHLKLYLQAFEDRRPFTSEFRVLNLDGKYRWLLNKAQPWFKPDNQFAGYIGSCVDITELKDRDQRRSDFIGVVSHELKTPLASMSGYIQMLDVLIEEPENDMVTSTIQRARRQIGKMSKMITEFLDLARIDDKKIIVHQEIFNMAELVKEAEEEALASIATHEVIFAPVEETIVYADKDKIGHVISNLISNAVKYSPPESAINIDCVTRNNRACVSVRDEGIGIHKEDQRKLFEKFYRVESDLTDSISGFGIGLYLCAEIVHQHSGEIRVESEPGRGSVFSFDLPVHTGEEKH